jgi:hypothetical protein
VALTDPQKKGMARWILFSVLLGALPVGLALVGQVLVDLDDNPVARGDLLLVSATLSFIAVGELLGATEDSGLAKIIFGGIAAALAFAATVLYALVTSADHSNGVLVGWASVIMWLSSATASTICVVYGKR